MAAKRRSAIQRQRAIAHPLRGRILAALDREGERSPVELASALDASLGVVSYHVRVLAEAGMVELARTSARRGAIQHHYRLTEDGAVSGSIALSAERADRLAAELRAVLDAARRDAEQGSAGSPDVEVTVLVHRAALA